MKTYLLPLLAAFALTVGTAAAQTTTQTTPAAGQMQERGHGRGHGRMQGTPDEMAQRQSQRLTQELGLSADQTAKVQQILLARGQEMQAMRGQAKDATNRDQMREQMKANRTKYDEQFKAVLTPEQYTKYTALQAEHKGYGGKGYGHGRMDADKAKLKQDKIKMKADAKATKVKVKADK